MDESSDGDSRAVLLLRPRQLAEAFYFPQTDRSRYWKLPYVSLEEFLSATVDIPDVSSVVSVGSAGERWGIGNIEYEEKEWRERIIVLMKDALIILCLIGTTPACRFENYLILSTSAILRKTIFISPAASSFRSRRRVGYRDAFEYYEDVHRVYGSAGVVLPPTEIMAAGALYTIDATTLRVGLLRPWSEVQVRVGGFFKDRTLRVRTLRSADVVATLSDTLGRPGTQA